MKKKTAKIIFGLLLAIIALVIFLYAFWKIPIPGVCELFPDEKETLVRHYTCSLALCTRGCSWVQQPENKMCIELDCTTQECKKECKSYCTDPPSSWPPKDERWDSPGGMCGYGYTMSLPLEQQVPLKGCDKKYFDWAIWSGTSDMHYLTEIYDMIKKLFPTFITEDKDGFTFAPLGDKCRGIGDSFYHPGLIFDKIEKRVWYSPRWQRNEWPIKGTGAIFLDPIESMKSLGCIDTTVPVFWGIPIPVYEQAPGYYQCLFRGNLKIWSEYKEDSNSCGDVWMNTSYPPRASFEIDVTPCEGKERCNGDCERIRLWLDEEACFDAKITNNLGTGSDFNFEMKCTAITGNCGGVGCVEPCRDKFKPNPLSVGRGEENKSTLTFTPTATGRYKIKVTAKPTAAYLSKADIVELRVVDFGVRLKGRSRQEVQENVHGEWDVQVENNLDKPEDFELTPHCNGCTCQIKPSDTVTVKNETEWETVGTLECWSSELGEYDIYVTAKSTTYGHSKDSENHVKLKVVKCWGDISLSVSSPVKSGDEVTVNASNLKDCAGEIVVFAVNDTDLEVGSCDPGGEDGTWCSVKYTANSPGTYTIYAKINLFDSVPVYSHENETDSAELTIGVDPPPDVDYEENDDKCIFRNRRCCLWNPIIPGHCLAWGGICDRCTGDVFAAVDVCTSDYCGDPQSCETTNTGIDDLYAITSSLCCIGSDDYYSNGPGDVPCLTTDTLTSGDEQTQDLWWWGVDNPRNVYTYITAGDYAAFGAWDCSPDNDHKDCTGGSGAPPELSSATCNEGYDPDFCELPLEGGGSGLYQTWLFIRISDDSRPVYGIFADIRPPGSAGVKIFLHKKSGTWIEAEDPDGDYIFRPTGWSWENIDAMLIGYRGDVYGYLYHVGLLAKDATHDGGAARNYFCRDPPTYEPIGGYDFYRIVDDGKKCYWSVDCDKWGSGWTGEPSTGLGPFLESNVCNCNNPDVTCGSGYCKRDNFCFYKVQCANGGWRGTLEECSSGTCTARGCV